MIKRSREDTLQSVFALFEDREIICSAFESGTISLAPIEGKGCPSGYGLWPLNLVFASQSINFETNTSTIANSSCTSKSQ